MKIIFIPTSGSIDDYTVIKRGVNNIKEVIESEDFRISDIRDGRLYIVYNREWLSFSYIKGKTRHLYFNEAYDVDAVSYFDIATNSKVDFSSYKYIGIIALVNDDWCNFLISKEIVVMSQNNK